VSLARIAMLSRTYLWTGYCVTVECKIPCVLCIYLCFICLPSIMALSWFTDFRLLRKLVLDSEMLFNLLSIGNTIACKSTE
jgi:hypothetical protein